MTEPKINLDIVSSPTFVPVMSPNKFSEASGIEIGVLTGWINRGYIQTIKIGKRRLINIASMTKEYSVED